MAKSNNQKGKILYLEKILRGTGENRAVTMQEILAELMEYGISAERKSIYDDLEVLRSFGMDVKFKRGKPGGYYLAGQTAPEKVELPEIAVEAEAAEKTAGTKVNAAAGTEGNAANANTAEVGFVSLFGKCTSEKGTKIKLLCSREKKSEVEAYFGTDAQYKEKGQGFFSVAVRLEEGPQFFGWLTAMGKEVHIVKPKKVAQAYRDYLKELAKEYKGI